MNTRTLGIAVVAALVVALGAYIGRGNPIQENIIPVAPLSGYPALVHGEAERATEQTQQLMSAYQTALQELDAQYTTSFTRVALNASQKAATYHAILGLIGRLAWDRVKGTSEAELYLHTHIDPEVTPVLSAYSQDLNLAMSKLDQNLRKVTVQLSVNIAAIGPGDAKLPPRIVTDQSTNSDFALVLKSLGRTATLNGVNLALFLIPSPVPMIADGLNKIALQVFGKQVLKVAASSAMSAAGPIGVVVDIAMMAWLAHDIYRAKDGFETEIFTSVKSTLDGVRTDSNAKALTFASEETTKFAKIQAEIVAQALQVSNTQVKK